MVVVVAAAAVVVESNGFLAFDDDRRETLGGRCGGMCAAAGSADTVSTMPVTTPGVVVERGVFVTFKELVEAPDDGNTGDGRAFIEAILVVPP